MSEMIDIYHHTQPMNVGGMSAVTSSTALAIAIASRCSLHGPSTYASTVLARALGAHWRVSNLYWGPFPDPWPGA